MTGTLVYALREVGTVEPRYIGLTDAPNFRLVEHQRNARYGVGRAEFVRWLLDCDVELVALSEYPTRKEALAAERATTRAMASLGFRLFNVFSNVAHPAKAVAQLLPKPAPRASVAA